MGIFKVILILENVKLDYLGSRCQTIALGIFQHFTQNIGSKYICTKNIARLGVPVPHICNPTLTVNTPLLDVLSLWRGWWAGESVVSVVVVVKTTGAKFGWHSGARSSHDATAVHPRIRSIFKVRATTVRLPPSSLPLRTRGSFSVTILTITI